MTEQICRAIVSPDGKISFDSAIVSGSTIDDVIQEDTKFGTMSPRNGKYFTYRAFDWDNKWISSKQIRKGIGISWNMVEKVIDIKCKEAKDGEIPDFSIFFRKTEDDPLLESNTLMYQYYPIHNLNSEHRGVCVVNTDFPWTVDGEGISLHLFDPEHYPKPTPNSKARTYDFDAVYQHEGPGHGLGLPHSKQLWKIMSSNYSFMAESIFDEEDNETIIRLQAKYPKRIMHKLRLRRWINYYLLRRDRY